MCPRQGPRPQLRSLIGGGARRVNATGNLSGTRNPPFAD
jgi:hypothetical protein